MKFGSVRLATRLGVAFGALALGLLIVACVGLSTASGLKGAVEDFAERDVKALDLVAKVSRRFEATGHLTSQHLYEEIGTIVSTIARIAGQTNLLALNAAIEAARAGEQGRGFAVVAEEVRQLAEESEHAAAEIGALIGQIQAETHKVVGVVEAGAERTQDGVATVERTRTAFLRIGESVEDMSTRVGDIATAIERISSDAHRMQTEISEVASVVEESSASAEEVSASTEQTSASTQEIAASAEVLARTAEDLERLVSRFKVAA